MSSPKLPQGKHNHEIADLRHAGIEFPVALSHCRDVVARQPRRRFRRARRDIAFAETVEQELKWIDDHVDGKPYGTDVLIPENISTAGEKDVT